MRRTERCSLTTLRTSSPSWPMVMFSRVSPTLKTWLWNRPAPSRAPARSPVPDPGRGRTAATGRDRSRDLAVDHGLRREQVGDQVEARPVRVAEDSREAQDVTKKSSRTVKQFLLAVDLRLRVQRDGIRRAAFATSVSDMPYTEQLDAKMKR